MIIMGTGRKLEVNLFYFLQGTVPPIGFAIICKQQHIIRFLLEVEGYDKSIYGVRSLSFLVALLCTGKAWSSYHDVQ